MTTGKCLAGAHNAQFDSYKLMFYPKPMNGVKKITVKFDAGIPSDVQGVVLLNLEKDLRARTGLDCRVHKELMGDDSKLRVLMTQAQRDKL